MILYTRQFEQLPKFPLVVVVVTRYMKVED